MIKQQKNKLEEIKIAAQQIAQQQGFEPEKLGLLKSIIENVHDAIVITEAEPINGNGPKILFVNQAFTETTGYQPHEIIGKTPRILQGPKTDRAKLAKIREALENWQPILEEVINYRKDGSEFWTELNIIPVADENGIFTNWISIQRNITERKKVEQKLLNQSKAFEQLNKFNQEVTSELNVQKTIKAFLQAARSVEGAKYSLFYYFDQHDHIKCIDFDGVHKTIKKKFLNKVNHRSLNKGLRVFENNLIVPVKTPSNELLGGLITCYEDYLDINEDVKKFTTNLASQAAIAIDNAKLVQSLESEKAKAHESEQYYRFLTEAIPQIIWTCSVDGQMEYYNPQWYSYTGLTPEKSLESNWMQAIHEEDFENCCKLWKISLETGKDYEVEYRFRRKDGKYLWHLARAYPIKREDGKVLKWFGSCTDIDDRKRIEEKTRESEAKFRHLFDSNIIGVFIADINGKIYEANKAFLDMTGYVPEDLANFSMSWSDMTPPEYVMQDLGMREVLVKEGTVSPYEKEYVRKDGKRVSVLVGAALFEENPNLTLAFVLDITERKEVERRKDEFISMASHELKTPITSMKIFTQMLQEALKQEEIEEASVYSCKVEEQIGKLTKLVIDLLDISKMQEGILEFAKTSFVLNDLVNNVIENYQASCKKHKLIVEEAEEITVYADKGRIEQVILNLLSNAIKYSPHANKVVISIKPDPAKHFVQVCVQDFGIGISEENQRRIFNRFFRVFGKSEKTFPGLGIGLYICSEIINGHKGSIWVESNKGEGSIVSFKLPLQLI